MKKYFAALTTFGSLLVPVVAFAQNFDSTYIDDLLDTGKGWLQMAITIIMILLTVLFLINIFKFINADPSKKPDAKAALIRSLIGLFLAVGVWGIINIATRIAGVDGDQTPDIACPPGTTPSTDGTRCLIR